MSITTCAPEERTDSRLSVDLLPYIWPVVGRSMRRGSRYLYWLEDGVALIVDMYSGATTARNIDATAPLGATRVKDAGTLTFRPSESVNRTIGSAAVSDGFAAQPESIPTSSASARRQAKKRFTSMVILHKI